MGGPWAPPCAPLGCPWGCLGALGSSLGVPWGILGLLGRPWGILGGPPSVLVGPLGFLARPRCDLGVPGSSLRDLCGLHWAEFVDFCVFLHMNILYICIYISVYVWVLGGSLRRSGHPLRGPPPPQLVSLGCPWFPFVPPKLPCERRQSMVEERRRPGNRSYCTHNLEGCSTLLERTASL